MARLPAELRLSWCAVLLLLGLAAMLMLVTTDPAGSGLCR
jgi:hypothetical protein